SMKCSSDERSWTASPRSSRSGWQSPRRGTGRVERKREPARNRRVLTILWRFSLLKETPMMLFWKIRYLDRTDKQFKDRCLYLHTKTLDPVTRAAVELIVENKSSRMEHEILKYRHLFVEGSLEKAPGNPGEWDKFNTVFLTEYFEDEAG